MILNEVLADLAVLGSMMKDYGIILVGITSIVSVALLSQHYTQAQNRQAYYKCLEIVQKVIDARLETLTLPYCRL